MSAVCRVCLASDLPMHGIENIKLLEMYAKLAGAQPNCEAGMPHKLCYICYLQLRKCSVFFAKVLTSEKILRHMILNGIEISKHSVAALQPKSSLSVSATRFMSINDSQTDLTIKEEVTVKEEKIEYTDENDTEENLDMTRVLHNLVTAQPISVHDAVKVEQVDIKIEALEAEELEYEESLLEADSFQHLMKEENEMNTYIDWSCDICNKQFARKGLVVAHLRTHRKLYCHICSTSYSNRSYLRQHMKIHTDQAYTCKLCGKSNTSKSNLLIHMRVHTGEKPFNCDICGKAFTFKASLIPHLRYHTGLRQYSCNQCKKRFVEAGTLRRHMIVHTKVKPFTCEQCPTTFTEAGSLRRHMHRHNKKSHYSCDICNKTYSRMDHLKRHVQTHSLEKPFSCDRCDKKYTEAGTLKRHKQTHHQLKLGTADCQNKTHCYQFEISR